MSTIAIQTRLKPEDIFGLEHRSNAFDIADLVKRSIVLDLLDLRWQINFTRTKIELSPPVNYDRDTVRASMKGRRDVIIQRNREWIDGHLMDARAHLADGYSALRSEISPVIEVCSTQPQHDLFRLFRYSWSSPYSEYVGRRMKMIIRDGAIPSRPIIGIAALGSSVIHIPERDNYIGWNKETRTNNIVYAMDVYVLGALPPYNELLGGKLIAYVMASNEVRQLYAMRYAEQRTLTKDRLATDLVGLFTTSLYGRSSQYNRIRYGGRLLYIPVGSTRGFGSLHISERTIELMHQMLEERGNVLSNRFGSGPSWRMRVIRTAADLLGFDSRILLRHAFKRSIYYVPLASNSIEFLRGEEQQPNYRDLPLEELSNYWRERWLTVRRQNNAIQNRVEHFQPTAFEI